MRSVRCAYSSNRGNRHPILPSCVNIQQYILASVYVMLGDIGASSIPNSSNIIVSQCQVVELKDNVTAITRFPGSNYLLVYLVLLYTLSHNLPTSVLIDSNWYFTHLSDSCELQVFDTSGFDDSTVHRSVWHGLQYWPGVQSNRVIQIVHNQLVVRVHGSTVSDSQSTG